MEGRGRFAQDERGLTGPEGPQNLLDQELPWGPEEVQSSSAVPGARASRSLPQQHTHITPARDSCQALDSAVLRPPQYRKALAGSCSEASPLLDPCLHCRVFTRRREGGADGLI